MGGSSDLDGENEGGERGHGGGEEEGKGLQSEVLKDKGMDVASMDALKKRIEVSQSVIS